MRVWTFLRNTAGAKTVKQPKRGWQPRNGRRARDADRVSCSLLVDQQYDDEDDDHVQEVEAYASRLEQRESA